MEEQAVAAAAVMSTALSRAPGLNLATSPGFRGTGSCTLACGGIGRIFDAGPPADDLLEHHGRFLEADVPALSQMVCVIVGKSSSAPITFDASTFQ